MNNGGGKMEGNNLIKEIADMREKAVKYDNLKDRYIDWADRIAELSREMLELSKEIDPVKGVMKERRKQDPRKKKIYEELVMAMRNGTQITRKHIETAYTDLNNSAINNLMVKLKATKGVEMVKDGKTVRYFYRSVV